MVRGISVTPDGDACVSCADDCTVKLWKVPFAPFETGQVVDISEWALEFTGETLFYLYMYTLFNRFFYLSTFSYLWTPF